MKTFVLGLVLAGVVALGALFFFGQPSTPAASAGAADTTLAAVGVPTSSGCWVPGDLIGEADPASVHCTSAP